MTMWKIIMSMIIMIRKSEGTIKTMTMVIEGDVVENKKPDDDNDDKERGDDMNDDKVTKRGVTMQIMRMTMMIMTQRGVTL